MSDDQPPAKATVSLPAVPPWAIELTRSVKEGFVEVRADVALVSNDLGLLKTRVSIIESLRVEDEARAVKLSGGVRGLSSADSAHEAQLAQERTAREELASKVDDLAKETTSQTLLLGQLLKLTEKPMVKLVATAIGTAILTWLGMKGLR